VAFGLPLLSSSSFVALINHTAHLLQSSVNQSNNKNLYIAPFKRYFRGAADPEKAKKQSSTVGETENRCHLRATV